MVRADLATAVGIAAAAERVVDLLGGLDVLIDHREHHQASDAVLAATWDDWQANHMSAVRLDRTLIPAMVDRGHGPTVQVSSAAARAVPPNGIPYSTVKTALNAYSKGHEPASPDD